MMEIVSHAPIFLGLLLNIQKNNNSNDPAITTLIMAMLLSWDPKNKSLKYFIPGVRTREVDLHHNHDWPSRFLDSSSPVIKHCGE